jgi:hypothetical protein
MDQPHDDDRVVVELLGEDLRVERQLILDRRRLREQRRERCQQRGHQQALLGTDATSRVHT